MDRSCNKVYIRLKLLFLLINALNFRSQLSNLQPVQVTELEVEFTKIEGQKAIPSRYLRSQKAKQAKLAVEKEEIEGIRYIPMKYHLNTV